MRVVELRLEEIRPNPDQPRKLFQREALEELAASIRTYGLIQPIVVRWQNPVWQIIAGERRWRASKLAGLTTVPCIETKADDAESAQLALVENIARRDLDPMEEAAAFAGLVALGLTAEEVARRVGKSPQTIESKMTLLRLDPALQSLVSSRHVQESVGFQLARLDRNRQIAAVETITTSALSRDQSLQLVDVMVTEMSQVEAGPLFADLPPEPTSEEKAATVRIRSVIDSLLNAVGACGALPEPTSEVNAALEADRLRLAAQSIASVQRMFERAAMARLARRS